MRLLWLTCLCLIAIQVKSQESDRKSNWDLLKNAIKITSSDESPFPDPTEGKWGPWSEGSECSRSCGGGVSLQERQCQDTSKTGSHSCIGPSKIYISCNIQDCPEGSKDYREEQCAEYNNIEFDGKTYEWIPYLGDEVPNKCALNCLAKGESFYYQHAVQVKDGTTCQEDSLDVCVDGVCQPVGCDMMLGSQAKEDMCRECNGDGSSCQIVTGEFTKPILETGYNDILLIPSGSTNIRIEETVATNNYLAMRNLSGTYFLNADWRINFPAMYKFAGANFHYTRGSMPLDKPEVISAKGPTTEAIYIVLLHQEKNEGIKYTYYIPNVAQSTYGWETTEWGECSQTCGGGSQSRTVTCQKDDGESAENLCDESQKPATTQPCSTESCPASWAVGEWQECSTTCGEGFQYRIVFCQQVTNGNIPKIVDSDECSEEKPTNEQACNKDVLCPVFETGPWSECSLECGPGKQTRKVTCQDVPTSPGSKVQSYEDDACDGQEKPSEEQECSNGPCEGVDWVISDWTECSGVCGHSMQTRQVKCVSRNGVVHSDDECESGRKPETVRMCDNDKAECKAQWHASQWAPCSVRCGKGLQTRIVVCAIFDGEKLQNVPDELCNIDDKLDTVKECDAGQCKGQWFAGPWSKCSAPCGGGNRHRELMCFTNGRVVTHSECDASKRLEEKEPCNNTPCDEDNLLIIKGGCRESAHGCCPDGMTASKGENNEGCPDDDDEKTDCQQTEFGCCRDDKTPAGGPFYEGCPDIPCKDSKYGCCSDDTTSAKGENKEGCPDEPETEAGAPGEIQQAPPTPIAIPEGDEEPKDDDENSGDGEDASTVSPDIVTDVEPESTTEKIVTTESPIVKVTNSETQKTEIKTEATAKPTAKPTTEAIAEEATETTTDAIKASTEEVSLCATFQFGCCPDGKTRALDENGSGCKVEPFCESMEFGCCNGTEIPALGSNGEGCGPSIVVGDCHGAPYGCCPDGKTSANGPEKANCKPASISACKTSEHGCCPDGERPAEGPNNEGCEIKVILGGCRGTEHGCCTDGVTAATGPNKEGCEDVEVDCETTEYGCCLDSKIAAQGPDNEGCGTVIVDPPVLGGCAGTQHGCCPDKKTSASGPNLQGCEIEQKDLECSKTTYGCCPDGEATALGLDFDGCGDSIDTSSCAFSRYGCCPDGVTEAQGSNFLGCTWVQESCSLPSAPGTCRNFTIGWNFDIAFGGCSRFWYSGCEGNSNRFENQELCKSICVQPEGRAKCQLPKVTGRCRKSIARWYYSTVTAQCEIFTYGGCLGNNNNFETLAECQANCLPVLDVCKMDKDPGPCKGDHKYWYHDTATNECHEFSYGGCRGNENRFDNKEDCELRCPPKQDPSTKTEETEVKEVNVCKMPKEVGPCKALLRKWFFDAQDGHCKPFTYGGCQGNGNNFETEEECRTKCNAKSSEDICTLPSETGPCTESVTKWFHDTTDGECKQFLYGGCEGNKNNFETFDECKGACIATKPIKVRAKCSLKPVTGPCRAQLSRWFYNTALRECQQFTYGGCQGNGNRFLDKQMCENTCIHSFREKPLSPDVCQLPLQPGQCKAYAELYYFNAATNACEKFQYSGCGGNGNRFLTKSQCVDRCIEEKGNTPEVIDRVVEEADLVPKSKEVCKLERDPGPCDGYYPKWYFDDRTQSCRRFLYTGCDGNENRFEREEDCNATCMSVKPDQVTDAPTTEGGEEDSSEEESPVTHTPSESEEVITYDVCSEEPDAGPCRQAQALWFYSQTEGTCKRFLYGGCKGNGNRFATEEKCKSICVDRTIETPEEITVAPTEKPEKPTEKPTGKQQDVCMLPSESGPCKAHKDKWFFDADIQRCRQFWYGGCQGNDNRFDSEDECMAACKPSEERSKDSCTLPKDSGLCYASFQRYFFNTATKACEEFIYGGCDGNENNFESIAECREVCGEDPTDKIKPDNKEACNAPEDSGPCYASFLKFYYDNTTDTCRPFIYGGCLGNGNNFKSDAECYETCSNGIEGRRLRKPSDCFKKQDAGDCQKFTPRWYHDAATRECSPFYYGGCGGNGNNFESFKDCDAMCSLVSPQCETLRCNLDCPYGLTVGHDGCEECSCYDPCEAHECPEDMQCQVRREECQQEPCSYRPTCTFVERPGICPPMGHIVDCANPNEVPISSECRMDTDCPNNEKCCDQGCGDYKCIPGVQIQPPILGGCASTQHGCCSDGVTSSNEYGSNCPPGGCGSTRYGCCPDGVTSALDENYFGCPEVVEPPIKPVTDGPPPGSHCSSTPYGCCPDGKTPAFANGENCDFPVIGGCAGTRYGCCPDGSTSALDENYFGCPEVVEPPIKPLTDGPPPGSHCSSTPYGCCPDDKTPAFANGENCDYPIVGGCAGTRYGCCLDGVTSAVDERKSGCPETEVVTPKKLGSCPPQLPVRCAGEDNGRPPRDECRNDPDCPGDLKCCDRGCGTLICIPAVHIQPPVLPPVLGGCASTPFGCCSDGETASNEFGTNCRPDIVGGCASTRWGCCADGVTSALGENSYGCPEVEIRPGTCPPLLPGQCIGLPALAVQLCKIDSDCPSRLKCCDLGCGNVVCTPGVEIQPPVVGSCDSTRWGCCPDGISSAFGENNLGCHCSTLPNGCCLDNKTPAQGPAYFGCPSEEGPCEITRYGCCPDGVTAQDETGSNCPKQLDCARSQYGCCQDGVTPAQGPNYLNCPDLVIIKCGDSRFGCCPDGKKEAIGPQYEGCDVPILGGCAGTRFGCCPDDVTGAQGKNLEGCPEQEPKITSTGPQQKIVGVGSTIEIPCEAIGVPRPRIAWYKDRTPISSLEDSVLQRYTATVFGLQIVEAKEDDSATFTCRAYNGIGAIPIREMTLIVSSEIPAVLPEVETPETPEVETPRTPEVETPRTPEVETPKTPEVETPRTPKVDTPEGPAVGTGDGDEEPVGVPKLPAGPCGEFGCCLDGTTPADGPSMQGCPEVETTIISNGSSDMEGVIGGTVRIMCRARGSPPPRFVWYKDRSPIEDDRFTFLEEGTLVIDGAQEGDSATYTCRAYNGIGGAPYRDFRLTIKEAAEPTTPEPKPETPVESQTDAPPSESSTETPEEPLDCPQIEDCSLGCVDPFYGKDENGCPMCGCTNPCDTMLCPVDKPVCVLKEVVCVKDPCPPQPVCQPREKEGVCPGLEGTTNPNCINECEVDDDCRGERKCCLSICGRICTDPASNETIEEPENVGPACLRTPYGCCLDGNSTAEGYNYQGCPEMAPVITNNFTDIATELGSTVRITCNAIGQPKPQILWYKNRFPMSFDHADTRVQMLSNGTLSINQAVSDDSASYTCRAYNGIGVSAIKSINVLIQVPVTMNGTNSLVVVHPNGQASMRCTATGVPSPQIRWLKNGALLLGKQNTIVQPIENGSMLTVNDATERDEGDYICEADNSVGKPGRWTFTLSIEAEVTATILRHNRTFEIGSTVELECVAEGIPQPTIAWLKGRRPIDTDDRITQEGGRLVIRDVTRDDSGKYFCKATNEASSSTAETRIRIQNSNVPAGCEDRPKLANCRLIIQHNLCGHRFFSKFCCRSCYEAGQIQR